MRIKTLKLVCPACGFRFTVHTTESMWKEDERVLRRCPCGAMMREVTEEETEREADRCRQAV